MGDGCASSTRGPKDRCAWRSPSDVARWLLGHLVGVALGAAAVVVPGRVQEQGYADPVVLAAAPA
jgi:hypothetical protein